jgi:SAM-dependent methyltransferase
MNANEPPEHVRRNRAYWDTLAPQFAVSGERDWAADEPVWGIWRIPESAAHLLPDDLAGRDAIELGCGTAYVSAWLARRGARVTGIDNSPAQLQTARRLQREHGLEFPLMLGNAEEVPLPDAGFDLAISEYGAALWADPHRWIAEASRLLRPGGELIFLTNSLLWMLTVPELEAEGPAGERLLRPQFGMYRTEWADSDGVEFHLAHGEWIQVLRAGGFEVTELLELRPPDGSTTSYTDLATLEWSQQWPSEEVWKARKRGAPRG